MKKNLLFLLMIYPFIGISQSSTNNTKAKLSRSTIFNMYYGTNQTIGINFLSGKEYVFGFDASAYLGKAGVGRDYTGTIGKATYPNDIYETRISPYLSGSILTGRKITNNFMLYAKIGIGSTRKYYNGYDSFQILDPSGYWFISEPSDNKFLLGGGLAYTYNLFAIVAGYDSFNGINIGIGLFLPM